MSSWALEGRETRVLLGSPLFFGLLPLIGSYTWFGVLGIVCLLCGVVGLGIGMFGRWLGWLGASGARILFVVLLVGALLPFIGHYLVTWEAALKVISLNSEWMSNQDIKTLQSHLNWFVYSAPLLLLGVLLSCVWASIRGVWFGAFLPALAFVVYHIGSYGPVRDAFITKSLNGVIPLMVRPDSVDLFSLSAVMQVFLLVIVGIIPLSRQQQSDSA